MAEMILTSLDLLIGAWGSWILKDGVKIPVVIFIGFNDPLIPTYPLFRRFSTFKGGFLEVNIFLYFKILKNKVVSQVLPPDSPTN